VVVAGKTNIVIEQKAVIISEKKEAVEYVGGDVKRPSKSTAR